MDIAIRELPPHVKKDAKEVLSKPLGFGQVFCDRMFKMKWNPEQGWHDAEIAPYGPLSLDPAALVLHYAQEIFEGMKAYRLPDGGVGLFRPEMNCARLNDSAERLMMPTIPVEDQMQAINMLVSELQEWVPNNDGYALYIRPTMIAVNAELGVKPAREYLFYIICSPVSGYFADGFKPVSVVTSTEYSRACIGGTGAAKCGGNYAASLRALAQAKDEGYSQNIWLDAQEHRYIEEMGGMNLMFVYGDTIKTSPLTGTILPGITRNSISTMIPDMGLKFEETMLDIDQVCADIDNGVITEVFACGTAAVITAIDVLAHKGVDHKVADGKAGDVTMKLYNTITSIQSGKAEDRYDWTKRVV